MKAFRFLRSLPLGLIAAAVVLAGGATLVFVAFLLGVLVRLDPEAPFFLVGAAAGVGVLSAVLRTAPRRMP